MLFRSQGEMLGLFMGELNKVIESVNPDRIDVLYWDTEVAGHETYKGNGKRDLVHRTKPRGGGGTDPSCVSKYLRDENLKPEAIIVLTDGYVPNWGDQWEAPIMWVISGGNKSAVADHGKTLYLED